MDIVAILNARIDTLPEGEYITGLRAVQSHIASAIRHLNRGKQDKESSLFTDAIYRCNQAFEGSLKEAYRVLKDKDPSKFTPDQIEKYMEETTILRHRVLEQLRNYRQNWRNPSTHDYKLDFDEDEALLAIVTVTAFAIVLSDQIVERLAFNSSKLQTEADVDLNALGGSLFERICAITKKFGEEFDERPLKEDGGSTFESRLVGALGGVLSARLRNASVTPNYVIEKGLARIEVDLFVAENADKVIIEAKMGGEPIRKYESRLSIIGPMLWNQEANGLVFFRYSGKKQEYTIDSGPADNNPNVTLAVIE